MNIDSKLSPISYIKYNFQVDSWEVKLDFDIKDSKKFFVYQFGFRLAKLLSLQ